MAWWMILGLIAVGIPAVYLLYAIFGTVRLLIEAGRLSRECASRKLRLEWKLYKMLWSDLEDPINLDVTVHGAAEAGGAERQFSFSIFRSLMTPNLEHTSVKVQPLLLSSRLRGRVVLEAKTRPSRTSSLHGGDDFELHSFGSGEIDARYRLSEKKAEANAPDVIDLVRATLTQADVQKELADYEGYLVFERGHLVVRPGADGASFFDGIAHLVRLTAALDAAVKTASPYR
jgi:hypothetical protein